MALILDTSALVALERALEDETNPALPEEDVGLPVIVWAEALRFHSSARRCGGNRL